MEFNFDYNEKYPNWIRGIYGNYSFEAKMFDEPSEYGIARGRVSKLTIYDSGYQLVHYERGWDYGSDLYNLYHPLVNELEGLPPIPEDVWDYAFKINPYLVGE